jgi:hypothetical protein
MTRSRKQGSVSGFGMGSLLGMFRFHDVTVCKSEDKSFYCQFMKYFKLFVTILLVIGILYVLYKVFLTKKGLQIGGNSCNGGLCMKGG